MQHDSEVLRLSVIAAFSYAKWKRAHQVGEESVHPLHIQLVIDPPVRVFRVPVKPTGPNPEHSVPVQ